MVAWMVVRSALLTAEGLEELCHVLCCLLCLESIESSEVVSCTAQETVL